MFNKNYFSTPFLSQLTISTILEIIKINKKLFTKRNVFKRSFNKQQISEIILFIFASFISIFIESDFKMNFYIDNKSY